MQTPVYVLNQQMQREQGHKAQLSNIQAAKAVADIIRTTLGPRSMLKMLLDPLGGIVMTNDGNAILREINVSPSPPPPPPPGHWGYTRAAPPPPPPARTHACAGEAPSCQEHD